jgi:hypothetical protein
VAAGDGDFLLAVVDDVAVLPVRKSGEEVDVVEVAHGEETLLPSAEPQAAVLDLPIALGLSSHCVGELVVDVVKLFFVVVDKRAK